LLEFPEVFLQEDAPKGFAAIVGNPPFIAEWRMRGTLGTDYRDFLVETIARGRKGRADICAYFFLRVQEMLCRQGCFGLIATNTIAQEIQEKLVLNNLLR
jgi:hypothetical protein